MLQYAFPLADENPVSFEIGVSRSDDDEEALYFDVVKPSVNWDVVAIVLEGIRSDDDDDKKDWDRDDDRDEDDDDKKAKKNKDRDDDDDRDDEEDKKKAKKDKERNDGDDDDRDKYERGEGSDDDDEAKYLYTIYTGQELQDLLGSERAAFALLTGTDRGSSDFQGLNSTLAGFYRASGYAGDDWTIASVSAFGTVAPVPLPTTLPLLGGALAGLGFVARRRRRNAARHTA